MNNMFSLITELLHSNVCVVVPNLGGFVVNRKSAVVDVRTGLFCPPSVQVVFNPKLNHNDGLLCQAWANRMGCTMAEATGQVDATVAHFNAELRAKGTVAVPGFGTFSVVENAYSFHSAIEQQGFSEGFGLQNFVAPLLNDGPKSKSVVVSMAKKAGVGVAATALAAVLFFPFGSSIPSNLASFAPVFKSGVKVEVDVPAQTVVEKANKAKSEMDTAKKAAMAAHVSNSCFYIVLKRFESADDANAFVSNWQSKLSDSLAVVPVTDRFFAVSCASTKNAELAQKMMDNVRNNSSFKETFILYR